MKQCCTCKKNKSETHFNKNKRKVDGLNSRCKECRHKYYVSNSDEIYKKVRKRVLKNKDKWKEYQKQYYKKNKIQLDIVNKKYYNNNKKAIMRQALAYILKRRKNDLSFKLLMVLRTRIWRALSGKVKKSIRTIDLVGCSMEFLKEYLATKFKEGMSWDNYGQWHIDHKRPCKQFDLRKICEQRKCFHYSNLQPLWAIDNIKKGGKWPAS